MVFDRFLQGTRSRHTCVPVVAEFLVTRGCCRTVHCALPYDCVRILGWLSPRPRLVAMARCSWAHWQLGNKTSCDNNQKPLLTLEPTTDLQTRTASHGLLVQIGRHLADTTHPELFTPQGWQR